MKEITNPLYRSEAYSLYELNNLVRRLIEDNTETYYWVRGELAEGRVGYNGHFYGELVQKDDAGLNIIARARVTCWTNVYKPLEKKFFLQTGEHLRAGLQLSLHVRVTFSEQYGYALNIDDVDPTYTLGDMAQQRRLILQQLTEDGIIDDNKQLILPTVIKRIAVISSATAAGWGDFRHQLEDNEYGLRFVLKLFPAVMQGQHVTDSITAALEAIAEEADRWDVVTIIRGGGAQLDLSDFDSYPLAACIALFPLPVITGIGHQRDETVLDSVAHLSLKTPTAVAAWFIDRLVQQLTHLDELQRSICKNASVRLQYESKRLSELALRFPLIFNAVKERHTRLLERLQQQLESHAKTRLEREQHRLELLETRLRVLDPIRLLSLGYSITLVNGKPIRDVADVREGDTVVTRLEKGVLTSTITSCKKN